MIPHHPEAEADVLAACLYNQQARELVFTSLVPEDFYVPRHATAYRAMLRVSHRGERVDPVSVGAQMAADGDSENPSRWLRSILAQMPGGFGYSTWVRMVADAGARRRLMVAADSLKEKAGDESLELDAITKEWVETPEQVRVPIVDVEPAEEITSLVATEEHGGWVIENTLRRRERVIFTGGEGTGKSEFGRIAAISVASGVHMFTHQAQEPLPTLVVDFENEAGDIGDAARRVANKVRYSGGCVAKSRTQGLDLLNARDERWLDSLVAHHRPALVVLGPLYKMYRGSEGKSKFSEEAAEHVSGVLDRLRVAHDCALWIEAHAPHGDGGDRGGWRPRGSALWMGWPNFGFGLKRVSKTGIELKRWRGDRHRGRRWPWGLTEGGPWSWTPIWDKNERLAG